MKIVYVAHTHQLLKGIPVSVNCHSCDELAIWESQAIAIVRGDLVGITIPILVNYFKCKNTHGSSELLEIITDESRLDAIRNYQKEL